MERLPSMEAHAGETERLGKALLAILLELGGRAGGPGLPPNLVCLGDSSTARKVPCWANLLRKAFFGEALSYFGVD